MRHGKTKPKIAHLLKYFLSKPLNTTDCVYGVSVLSHSAVNGRYGGVSPKSISVCGTELSADMAKGRVHLVVNI